MTTIAMTEPCCERTSLLPAVSVAEIFQAYLRWRRQRRTLACVSRLSEHLMRDAGLDPEDVYDAVPGRWEEAHPGRSRIR